MPVVGVMLKRISGEKKIDGMVSGVKVNNGTKISTVEEAVLTEVGKKGLKIGFEYIADYKAMKVDVGKISISGSVLYIDNQQGKIVEEWKKSKKLPDNVNIEVLNNVLRKCIIKAVQICDDIGLPTPIPLPVASSKKKAEDSRYIG